MTLSDWFKRKNSLGETTKAKRAVPDGVWSKCDSCDEAIINKQLERNLNVCPRCQFHMPLSASTRINQLTDPVSFNEMDAGLLSGDPLKFSEGKSYRETVETACKKTSLKEAVVCGTGKIDGRVVCIAVMDFKFVGGSMGSVVGEKVTRLIELAANEKLPVLTVVASGGARMQEGMFSLMQMAKTSAAVARFQGTGSPFVSLLTHPSTGGVMASFATLADVIVAEPKALIGFAGPRVIERTIKQRLPKDFQRAESMLKHGMIDMVVPRSHLKSTLTRIFDYLAVERL